MKHFEKWFFISILLIGCNASFEKDKANKQVDVKVQVDTVVSTKVLQTPIIDIEENSPQFIATINPKVLVEFAKTLSGIPYKYASIDPAVGFDCSGFITYVFNHFNIAVPRSSVDFTNVGIVVEPTLAKEGDLILFTGTVDSIRIVGHMGIVSENIDTLKFIHSTSGKANGVTISPLNEHYKKRFVKVIRVFED